MSPAIFFVILIPVIEIYLFIKIGSQIGALTTILFIFLTAIIGVYYAKYEGLNTLKAGISQLSKNETPAYEVISGAAIAFAALLLILPGFATDCLPILIPVLTKIFGQSKIGETIFTNRFMAVPELNRMGADIKIKKNFAVINGEKKLNSADCISSDLRTTFSIILGAIVAKGSSTISRIYHGLRGYSNLQLKLRKLGIKVKMKT